MSRIRQRARPVESSSGLSGAQAVEGRPVPRSRERHLAHVVSEVELGILNEHGTEQLEGHGNEPPPECWKRGQPLREVRAETLDRERAGLTVHGRGPDDGQAHAVDRLRR
jgi:hypothetical protein